MTKSIAGTSGPVDTRYQRMAIEAHLATVPANAPIRAIRALPEFEAKLQAFETADASAVAARDKYDRMGRFVLLALTVGALISAVLLLPSRYLNEAVADGLGVLYIAVLIVSLITANLMSALSRIEAWMKARGEAEQLRGEIFDVVLRAPVPAGAEEAKCTAGKLGFIEAAYFQDQLKYFASKDRQFKAWSSNWTLLRLLGYLLFGGVLVLAAPLVVKGLAAFGVPVHQGLVDFSAMISSYEPNKLRVAVAAAASSLLTFASARAALHLDARNAAHYAETARRVEALMAARKSAVERDSAALKEHYESVRRVLETEHFAWFVPRLEAVETAAIVGNAAGQVGQ